MSDQGTAVATALTTATTDQAWAALADLPGWPSWCPTVTSGFTWESSAPGVHSVGVHDLVPTPDGTRIDLELRWRGPLRWVLVLLYGRLARRYVATEAAALAAELGTSGRMLHYHFGSREGLLAAVAERVERGERAVLTGYLTETGDPFAAGARFWPHVAAAAQTFGPLFFELSAHAMHGRAADLARLAVATTRGLLLELAITGDRTAADRAIAEFAGMLRWAAEPA